MPLCKTAFTRLNEDQDIALEYLCEMRHTDRSSIIRETLEHGLGLSRLATKARSFFAQKAQLMEQMQREGEHE